MASTCFHFVFLVCILKSLFVISLSTIDSYRKPLFSTKTPYFWVNDENEEIIEDSETMIDYNGKSCQVIHISSLIRHGARYPGLKWIRRISSIHESLMKSVQPTDELSFLQEWSNPFHESKEKELSELGEDEQYELGKRFGERFKLLYLNDIENIKFLSSSKQRTKASASEFHEGLMDSLDGDDETLKPIIDDIKLRFHDNCKMFTMAVEKNSSTLVEYKKFKDGKEVTNVAVALSKKLGIDHILTADEVNSIYQQCSFELQLFNKSDWCHLIDDQHYQVIEYLNDLKQYWKKAYGHYITANMACPLVRHIFTEMDTAIHMNNKDEEHTVAVFRFGHAETLAPLYAALGLFNDSEPLKADNFESHKNRLFQSSKIMPFSANIAMALYDCDEEDKDMDANSLFVIKFFVNEKPVIIPACGETICPYKLVRDYYSDKIDNCDFKDVCSVDKSDKHDEL